MQVDDRKPTVLYAVTVATSAYVALRGQLDALQKGGYRVVVICSPEPGLDAFASREGVEVVPIPMSRGIGSGRDLLALYRSVRVIARIRPCAVNVATPKASLVVIVAAWLLRVPVRIYSLWGLRLEGEDFGSLRFRLLWCGERLTAAASTVVLCASSSLRAKAITLGLTTEQRSCVLADGSTNGVDTTRFSPPDPERRAEARARFSAEPDELVIGFVGRLVLDKGVPLLLDAFEQVSNQCPARLLVVGDYDEADPLPVDVRRRLERHTGVHITGLQKDTAPWYAAMDVVVLPSKREGLPNVLLEAAATGLPTVTTDATGCPDAIESGRTGTVVPRDDVSGFADAVLAIALDRRSGREMGRAGREMVQRKFAQPLVWANIAGMYRNLLRPGGTVS